MRYTRYDLLQSVKARLRIKHDAAIDAIFAIVAVASRVKPSLLWDTGPNPPPMLALSVVTDICDSILDSASAAKARMQMVCLHVHISTSDEVSEQDIGNDNKWEGGGSDPAVMLFIARRDTLLEHLYIHAPATIVIDVHPGTSPQPAAVETVSKVIDAVAEATAVLRTNNNSVATLSVDADVSGSALVGCLLGYPVVYFVGSSIGNSLGNTSLSLNSVNVILTGDHTFGGERSITAFSIPKSSPLPITDAVEAWRGRTLRLCRQPEVFQSATVTCKEITLPIVAL